MNFVSELFELVKIFDVNDIELSKYPAFVRITNVLCINKISYQIFKNNELDESNTIFASKSTELGNNYDFSTKTFNEKLIVLRIYRYQYAAELGELEDLFKFFSQIILNKLAANENYEACNSLMNYDQSYGIYNVNYMNRHIQKVINNGDISNYYIIYMNIINCRTINTIFGGANADKLLRQFCNELTSYVDETKGEVFARLGGDNYLLLIQNDNVNAIVEKIKSVNVSFINDDNDNITYTIDTRLGLVNLSPSNNNIPSIMNLAAVSYGFARDPHNPDIYVLDYENTTSDMEEENYAEEIKSALKDEKFLVYYQPIVSKNNDEVKLYSAEALIRWRKSGEMLNPRTFLQIADKYHLMCEIDLFVLKTVCSRIKNWIDEGLSPVCVHCNFADSDLLTTNLAEKIIQIIDKYDIHHSLINIEFTESAYHKNKQAFTYIVNYLHENGIKVSIDNFGKSFTSLELFEQVDFSTLKIDSTIVNSELPKTKILLSSLISLADKLGIEVVCQGADTINEIERAFTSGCDIFQTEVYEKALSERYFTNRLKNPYYSKN